MSVFSRGKQAKSGHIIYATYLVNNHATRYSVKRFEDALDPPRIVYRTSETPRLFMARCTTIKAFSSCSSYSSYGSEFTLGSPSSTSCNYTIDKVQRRCRLQCGKFINPKPTKECLYIQLVFNLQPTPTLAQKAECIAVRLRLSNERSAHPRPRARKLTKGGDRLRVQRNRLAADLVQPLATQHKRRQNDHR
jgi:hypothetical protein